MQNKKSALDKKFEIIKKTFGEKSFFKVEDAQNVLNIKRSTLYWDLYNMVEQGYLTRVGKGKYTLNYHAIDDKPLVSFLANKISEMLQETGLQFYISGIDVLLKHMQHVPDSYPIMLFADKYSKDEIEDMLLKNNIHVVSSNELKTSNTIVKLNTLNDIVILYETSKFDYAANGFASNEKAFVDLYYEVTRQDFPLPLQELARIYSHMEFRGVIDKKKLIQAAYDRNTHYDIRFIVESKYISEAAYKFVDMIRSGNK
ncbi:MAG: hypothetical protein GX154_07375 [Clostridiales bacterium]|nr:hypothetical protein [Clostridiales bacterium]